MKSIRKTGRIVGVLFLLTILAGSAALSLRGLSSSLIESQNFLNVVFENSLTMKISVLLDLLAGAIGIGIAIILFPVLKQYSRRLAMGYFAYSIIGFVILVMSDISRLSLISLSKKFVTNGAVNFENFKALALLSVEDYFWAHFLHLITYSIGASLLFFALYKTKLVPRVLSIWGILAMISVFTATMLQIFDYKVSFMFYAQNGIHFITFTFWLIVKGFNSSFAEEKFGFTKSVQ